MHKCSRCGVDSQNGDFFKNSSNKWGLSDHCKSCFREYEGSPHRRAKRTWNTIKARAGGPQSSYKKTKVLMSREEFLIWAIPEYERWMTENPTLIPSVDRIDPSGHYEVNNLRIIERGENARLASNHPNVHAPEGKAWCPTCKEYLGKDNFWKCRSNYNGLQNRCKEHQRQFISQSRSSRS